MTWQDDARCADADSELFVGDQQDVRAAKAVCAACPVSDPCLTYALTTHSHWGVWGGKSEDERKAIRKRLDLPVAQKQYRAGLPGPKRQAS